LNEKILGFDVLSYVIKGIYLNEINEPSIYVNKNIEITPQVSFIFLYSYARFCCENQPSLDKNTLTITKLIKDLVENSLKADDSKAFEIFNALYMLLLLQLRSFLAVSLEDEIKESPFLKEFTKKTTLTVKDLFFGEISENKNLLNLEISLIDKEGEPFTYIFDRDEQRPFDKVEPNKQPGRSLKNRFSVEKINFNTFYLSSLINQTGMEGGILLPLSNGDSLWIPLQTKLQFENTTNVHKISEKDLENFKNSGDDFANFLSSNTNQKHVGKIHTLPLLISNKALKPSANLKGVEHILHEDLKKYLGFSFKIFNFRNSFISN
jgi:hypothetical protein